MLSSIFETFCPASGKNRDRGSIFSHETALLAHGDHATARNVFSVLFSYAYYLFVQATKLSLNVSSGKFLPIKTRVDLRSVSFQSRPREISKLI